VADVADNQRAVAEAQLRAVVLADLQSLGEAEHALQHCTASRTSGYMSTGITVAAGIERSGFTRPS
jgi:hypothetical protein